MTMKSDMYFGELDLSKDNGDFDRTSKHLVKDKGYVNFRLSEIWSFQCDITNFTWSNKENE